MKYLLLFILTINSQLYACEALESAGLDFDQKLVLRHSFEYGRPYDLSYSLAAIAWKESSGGRYRINLQDPAAGIHMITIKNALSYSGRKDTPFNRNKLAQELIENPNLSAGYSVINLNFWRSVYGNNWGLVWRSYNGGTSGSKASQEYAISIAEKVNVIRKCNWD